MMLLNNWRLSFVLKADDSDKKVLSYIGDCLPLIDNF